MAEGRWEIQLTVAFSHQSRRSPVEVGDSGVSDYRRLQYRYYNGITRRGRGVDVVRADIKTGDRMVADRTVVVGCFVSWKIVVVDQVITSV